MLAGVPVLALAMLRQAHGTAANDVDTRPPILGAPPLDFVEPPVPPSRQIGGTVTPRSIAGTPTNRTVTAVTTPRIAA
ncbi:hypothetical protein GCM10023232_27170 [Sphingosinicella ginsenosidimutans]